MSDRYDICYGHTPHGGKPGPILVQDGWTADGRRIMRAHYPQWLPIECGHIERGADPRCDGCRWRDGK